MVVFSIIRFGVLSMKILLFSVVMGVIVPNFVRQKTVPELFPFGFTRSEDEPSKNRPHGRIQLEESGNDKPSPGVLLSGKRTTPLRKHAFARGSFGKYVA